MDLDDYIPVEGETAETRLKRAAFNLRAASLAWPALEGYKLVRRNYGDRLIRLWLDAIARLPALRFLALLEQENGEAIGEFTERVREVEPLVKDAADIGLSKYPEASVLREAVEATLASLKTDCEDVSTHARRAVFMHASPDDAGLVAGWADLLRQWRDADSWQTVLSVVPPSIGSLEIRKWEVKERALYRFCESLECELHEAYLLMARSPISEEELRRFVAGGLVEEQDRVTLKIDLNEAREKALVARAAMRAWPALAGMRDQIADLGRERVRRLILAVTRFPFQRFFALATGESIPDEEQVYWLAHEAGEQIRDKRALHAARAALAESALNHDYLQGTSPVEDDLASESVHVDDRNFRDELVIPPLRDRTDFVELSPRTEAAWRDALSSFFSRRLWSIQPTHESGFKKLEAEWYSLCKYLDLEELAKLYRKCRKSGLALDELERWVGAPLGEDEPGRTATDDADRFFERLHQDFLSEHEREDTAMSLYRFALREPDACGLLLGPRWDRWAWAAEKVGLDAKGLKPEDVDAMAGLRAELAAEFPYVEPDPLWLAWMREVQLPRLATHVKSHIQRLEAGRGREA